MPFNSDCVIYSGVKKVYVVSEKGKSYRLVNVSGMNVTKYEVDPCLIAGVQEKKCDYLLLAGGEAIRRAIFVELKGTDIAGAIRQIENTIRLLGHEIKEYQWFGRIVGRRVTPDIRSRRSALEEMLCASGGNLLIASVPELLEKM